METLPLDTLRRICCYLKDSEAAMLSLTCKYGSILKIPLLKSFIVDRNLEWVKLALNWGCKLTKELCYLIDSVEILGYIAFTNYYFTEVYSLSDEFTKSVYSGACSRGNIKILQLIDRNCRCSTYYDECIYGVEDTKTLDYLCDTHLVRDLPKAAVENLDVWLLKYCREKQIKYTDGLQHLRLSVDPIKLEEFLTLCKKENINFERVDTYINLPAILVLVNHSLVKRVECYTVKELFMSKGLIDINSIKHVNFVKTCIEYTIMVPKANLSLYLQMKEFLKREGMYKQMKPVILQYEVMRLK